MDRAVAFSFAGVSKTWNRAQFEDSPEGSMDVDDEGLQAAEEAGVEQRQEEAEEALTRIVDKRDFRRMEIVGQFNAGFIIARRRAALLPPRKGQSSGEEHDDLFIVDQHAADEKYNFENLQKERKIQSQRLIAAKPLPLSTSDEVVAMDNLSRIRDSGFDISIDYDAPAGHRISLLAMPISKDVIFDDKDLEELLSLLADRTGREIVRPSKMRRMFASRACRMSIMIGTTLKKTSMKKVVSNMGTMDQPWSCPHGRPTMRWLASLQDERTKRNAPYQNKAFGFKMLTWFRRSPTAEVPGKELKEESVQPSMEL
ncbi:hypothetical protein BT69DRAFT_1308868 [Atractiella rhizophila]|nr:hypothetical protein BT69DRAFT_1308868 [Atractiella rhizophila]